MNKIELGQFYVNEYGVTLMVTGSLLNKNKEVEEVTLDGFDFCFTGESGVYGRDEFNNKFKRVKAKYIYINTVIFGNMCVRKTDTGYCFFDPTEIKTVNIERYLINDECLAKIDAITRQQEIEKEEN